MATATKKAATKKKAAPKKNKLGVVNSLVNNINKRKEKGIAGSKATSTVSKNAYKKWRAIGAKQRAKKEISVTCNSHYLN